MSGETVETEARALSGVAVEAPVDEGVASFRAGFDACSRFGSISHQLRSDLASSSSAFSMISKSRLSAYSSNPFPEPTVSGPGETDEYAAAAE